MRFASLQFAAGAVLLLLSLGLCALWVRTLFIEDVWRIRGTQRFYYINSCFGGVQFGVINLSEFNPQRESGFETFPLADFNRIWQMHVNAARYYASFAGFKLLRGVPWIPTYWTICVPIWFLLLFTGPSGYWLTRRWWLHLQRRREHLCSRCGYDLRASPDRCPECGAVL